MGVYTDRLNIKKGYYIKNEQRWGVVVKRRSKGKLWITFFFKMGDLEEDWYTNRNERGWRCRRDTTIEGVKSSLWERIKE